MKIKQMKTNNLIKIAIFSLMLFVGNIALAQTTISGSITDSETGEAIPGANIIVIGSRTGAATDFDGNFVLTSSAELPFNIEITSVGFNSSIIEVTSPDQQIAVSLEAGQNLDEIIISASRRPQKISDSPQSVSIITAKDLENNANVTDPIRSLIDIPGVQLQQQSANVINIEMRAGSGVFGTSTFPMLDYRNLFNPTSSSFLSYQSGLSNIDIARIEVVRGANSALYGPGVSSGIVHFLSKNPIDYPGTTIELIGGELATTGAALRHAWANEKKTFGYKINAKYLKGNDFNFDPNDPNDQANIASFKDEIRRPVITNGVADATQQGSLLLSNSELYPDGKGLKTNYRNSTINAHLEFRPNDKTSMFLSSGLNTGDGFFANSQGYGRTDGSEFWTQARIQTGGLFAQFNYVSNDGGGDDNPTYLYGTGLNQITKRNGIEAQVQYNFQIPSFLNSDFTVGYDYRINRQDSENTIW
jgi:outer membrane receptor for ferrienterochelin and colicins